MYGLDEEQIAEMLAWADAANTSGNTQEPSGATPFWGEQSMFIFDSPPGPEEEPYGNWSEHHQAYIDPYTGSHIDQGSGRPETIVTETAARIREANRLYGAQTELYTDEQGRLRPQETFWHPGENEMVEWTPEFQREVIEVPEQWAEMYGPAPNLTVGGWQGFLNLMNDPSMGNVFGIPIQQLALWWMMPELQSLFNQPGGMDIGAGPMNWWG